MKYPWRKRKPSAHAGPVDPIATRLYTRHVAKGDSWHVRLRLRAALWLHAIAKQISIRFFRAASRLNTADTTGRASRRPTHSKVNAPPSPPTHNGGL